MHLPNQEEVAVEGPAVQAVAWGWDPARVRPHAERAVASHSPGLSSPHSLAHSQIDKYVFIFIYLLF